MSVEEIKQTKSNLIGWIEQLSDTNMLSFLESLKDSKADNDWWDNLSEPQIKHINEGLADAENGRVASSDEFWKKLKNA
jgi:predicted transcriptional regulator